MGHRLPRCVIAEHSAVRGVKASAVLLIGAKNKVASFKIVLQRRFQEGAFVGWCIFRILLCPSGVCVVLHLLQHRRDVKLDIAPFLSSFHLLANLWSHSMNADPTWFNQELLLTPAAVLCRKGFRREETHFWGLVWVATNGHSTIEVSAVSHNWNWILASSFCSAPSNIVAGIGIYQCLCVYIYIFFFSLWDCFMPMKGWLCHFFPGCLQFRLTHK